VIFSHIVHEAIICVFLFIWFLFHLYGVASFRPQANNFASIAHGHEKEKRIAMQGIVLTVKFPKFFKGFCGISTLENLPRSTADAGVGTVESLRHHIQHHAHVRCLSKQYAHNLHHNLLEPELVLHQLPKEFLTS
jgi:hypothetical protein